jgi:hypothetical protein
MISRGEIRFSVYPGPAREKPAFSKNLYQLSQKSGDGSKIG